MPRTKKSTEPEVSAAAEPKRPRTAAPTSAAASHKHTKSKKTAVDVEVESDSPATAQPSREQIARLAYSYWEERGYAGGSAEQDWLRAERELLIAAQNR